MLKNIDLIVLNIYTLRGTTNIIFNHVNNKLNQSFR